MYGALARRHSMQHRTAEPKHFQAAEQAFTRGDREAAYHLLRQALIENPAFVPAWISMSQLVDDVGRQRECLERALALDPHNDIAREGIETLRLRELLSSIRAPILAERGPEPRQIGAYLVEQRVISADQLQEALREQGQRRRRGEFIQFGDLLLERGWIAPNTLAHALVAQLQERIARHSGHAPQFLGEYLIAQGVITPIQLEAALEEQIRLRQAGKRIALGNLLVRNRYISARALQQVLDDQRSTFYNRMGD
jgi:hypothetical protein